MVRIPDDGAMEAALFGTAHIPTRLALEDCRKLTSSLRLGMESIMARIDVDLAEGILDDLPDLVFSDDPLPDDLDDGTGETVLALRDYTKAFTASQLVGQWARGIEKRGRMIGLGEYSARTSEAGPSSDAFDSAISRFGDMGRDV